MFKKPHIGHRVVADQDAIGDKIQDLGHNLFNFRRFLEFIFFKSCQTFDNRWYRYLWVDQRIESFFNLALMITEHTDFSKGTLLRVATGGLDIEHRILTVSKITFSLGQTTCRIAVSTTFFGFVLFVSQLLTPLTSVIMPAIVS